MVVETQRNAISKRQNNREHQTHLVSTSSSNLYTQQIPLSTRSPVILGCQCALLAIEVLHSRRWSNYIRTTVDNWNGWDLTLRELQWTVNSQRNETSGFTPNELIFMLWNVIKNLLSAAMMIWLMMIWLMINYLSDHRKREQAAKNINVERESWEKRFSTKHATPTIYHENDSVGESRKLELKYRVQYMIKKAVCHDGCLVEDILGMQVT